MAMQLEQVVPFGRSLNEYIQMFNLTDRELQTKILSVGDGPASFNAEGTELGYTIKSIDPLYVFDAEQISDRFYAVIDNIITQIERTPEDWVWNYHRSPQDLRKNRERVTQRFCEDYENGKAQGRYEVGEMPRLKYHDREYDLGLSSHFLFLYSDQLDEQFHWNSICEMLRICQEVRIFPLMTLMLQRSPHIEPIVDRLKQLGYLCEIQAVPYQLQRGGNEMLKITRA
jgi:hypothetical protein